jgi:hypothetical protein
LLGGKDPTGRFAALINQFIDATLKECIAGAHVFDECRALGAGDDLNRRGANRFNRIVGGATRLS